MSNAHRTHSSFNERAAKEVTAMSPMPSISSIKRIFFSPIDAERVQRQRDRVENDFRSMNLMNIR